MIQLVEYEVLPRIYIRMRVHTYAHIHLQEEDAVKGLARVVEAGLHNPLRHKTATIVRTKPTIMLSNNPHQPTPCFRTHANPQHNKMPGLNITQFCLR